MRYVLAQLTYNKYTDLQIFESESEQKAIEKAEGVAKSIEYPGPLVVLFAFENNSSLSVKLCYKIAQSNETIEPKKIGCDDPRVVSLRGKISNIAPSLHGLLDEIEVCI